MSSAPEASAALPPCGLYRTTVALPGHESQVASDRLVYFHNHSEQGPPLVLMPQSNTHNRWTFHDRGYLVESPEFIRALVPLRPEGYYVIRDHLHLSREEILPERTLVQLGYNREAEPILFVARFEENLIRFPDRGYRVNGPAVLEQLEPANFRAPRPKPVLH